MTGLHFVRQYEYRTLCGISTKEAGAYPHVNVLAANVWATRCVLCPVCADSAGVTRLGQLELEIA